jgi:hypothetical protein
VRASELLNGRWCGECWLARSPKRAAPRLSIVDMQETAASRGGRCLSDIYVNNRAHLRWQCHSGHQWDAIPALIRSGSWCPICSHRHRGTIDSIRTLAAERGGRCRSRVYHSRKEVLRFICAHGHNFTAVGTAVLSGAWCPACGEWDAPNPERQYAGRVAAFELRFLLAMSDDRELNVATRHFQKSLVERALAECGGNATKAARRLGIFRSQGVAAFAYGVGRQP